MKRAMDAGQKERLQIRTLGPGLAGSLLVAVVAYATWWSTREML